MNILVTGGAGFIGSNLVHYLLREAELDLGCQVDKLVNLDLLSYAGNRENIKDLDDDPRHVFVQGDICDAGMVAKLLREHRIDRVMHLAAESHVDRSIEGPEAFVKTNVMGTFTLLEAFRQHRAVAIPSSQPSFLHVSTDEVFGSLGPDDPAFDERTPYAPNSPYSASKAGSDHLVRAYFHTYGLPVVTTNCSNNYGPYQFPEKLLPLMIRKTLAGESLPVYGDGSNVRDWLYVGDHCRALAMALLRGKSGETYVIGGKCEFKNIDVVNGIIRTVRELAPGRVTKSAEELITFVKDRPGHDQRYAINPARIERELGWVPRENFTSGLRKTVQWYLDNDWWWQPLREHAGQRLGLIEPAQG